MGGYKDNSESYSRAYMVMKVFDPRKRANEGRETWQGVWLLTILTRNMYYCRPYKIKQASVELTCIRCTRCLVKSQKENLVENGRVCVALSIALEQISSICIYLLFPILARWINLESYGRRSWRAIEQDTKNCCDNCFLLYPEDLVPASTGH